MNERIKQLAEQAGGNPNYKAFRGYFLPPPPDYIDPATVNLEKFAELIVKECVSIVAKRKDQAIDDGWNVDEAMTMAEIDLEEHFGVK